VPNKKSILVVLACLTLPALAQAQQSLWTFSAGPIFLKRDNPDATPVFVEGNGNNGGNSDAPQEAIVIGDEHFAALCYASDFDFDYQVGLDVGIRRYVTENCSVEARYFGVNDWDASKYVFSENGVQFATNPPSGESEEFNPAAEGFAVYGSSLHSTEVNVLHRYNDWLTLIGGFRWIELGEMINGHTSQSNGGGDGEDLSGPPLGELVAGSGGSTFYNNVNNHLYGAQIGAEVLIWASDRWCTIDGFAKAGIYGNSADHAAKYVGGTNGTNSWWNHASRDSTSFVGELGITCSVTLLDWLAVRFGYEALWISDVALASNQIPITPTTNHDGAITTNDSVFYHGGLLQMVIFYP